MLLCVLCAMFPKAKSPMKMKSLVFSWWGYVRVWVAWLTQ